MSGAAEMTDERCLSDLEGLGDVLRSLGAGSLMLVADRVAFQASGASERLAPLLREIPVVMFEDFDPNPKLDQLLVGLQRYRSSPTDAVLAVGGGTAIDLAKLIAWSAPQTADVRELVAGRARADRPALPLVAVPTTAGTGSEATQFAVLYIDGVKCSIDSPEMMPRACVLDPALTDTLPPSITAHTGLDAFCQGVESLWSVASTDRSASYSVEAIGLAWHHLEAAVRCPDSVSRAAMCRASHLAGRAINLTRTTAPHAISYAFTSDHGVPHGQAVALTLGPLLVHNAGVTAADNQDPRGVESVRARIAMILDLLGCADAEQASREIDAFVRRLGCETRLSGWGISGRETIERIAGKVNPQRLGNNPRRVTHEQIVGLLESIV